jgi:hypothetical protein
MRIRHCWPTQRLHTRPRPAGDNRPQSRIAAATAVAEATGRGGDPEAVRSFRVGYALSRALLLSSLRSDAPGSSRGRQWRRREGWSSGTGEWRWREGSGSPRPAQPDRTRGQALKRGGGTCGLHGLSTASAVMAGRPLQREFTVRAHASIRTATHKPMASFVPISYAHSNALRAESACAVQGMNRSRGWGRVALSQRAAEFLPPISNCRGRFVSVCCGLKGGGRSSAHGKSFNEWIQRWGRSFRRKRYTQGALEGKEGRERKRKGRVGSR